MGRSKRGSVESVEERIELKFKRITTSCNLLQWVSLRYFLYFPSFLLLYLELSLFSQVASAGTEEQCTATLMPDGLWFSWVAQVCLDTQVEIVDVVLRCACRIALRHKTQIHNNFFPD